MKAETKIQILVFSSILVIIALAFILVSNRDNMVGLVSYANFGCCDLICQETSLAECPGSFRAGRECNDLIQCNVGCCIDQEDYCLDNYLRSNCQGKDTFIAKSCTNVPQCVTEKDKENMAQSTGYSTMYNKDNLIYSEPTTGKLGLPFLIKAFLFEPENISNVDVQITSTNYSENITLFDDGNHGDGNEGDGAFAGVWQSKEHPSFKGLETINLNLNENQNQLILSASDCLLLNPSVFNKDNNKNIIFAGYESNKGLSFFKDKANGLFGMISSLAAKDNLQNINSVEEYFSRNQYNYYLLSKTINQPVKETITDYIQDQCYFLFNKNSSTENITETKNVILFLDEDYPYCEQNKDFIRISPEFIFEESVTENNVPQDYFVDHFCKYVITKIELQEKYMAKTIPPQVEIDSLILNEPDNSNISLEFTIYDNKNESINYTIYLDLDHPLMHLKQDQTINGTKINLNLTIPDGNHILWIEAKDGDGNYDISKAINLNKNVNGFEVLISSLDKISYIDSPEVRFLILHKEKNQIIEYNVYVNESIILTEETIPLTENNVSTSLPPGDHVIYVRATDQSGNTAKSPPYYIIVGTDEEPALYEAGVEWYEGN
jgi:hypothetical protein